MEALNPTIKEITTLVAQLSDADQAALFKALKAQVLLLQARRLDESVKPNQVEMEKIVEVVQKARFEHPLQRFIGCMKGAEGDAFAASLNNGLYQH
jgi:hypothetical protein